MHLISCLHTHTAYAVPSPFSCEYILLAYSCTLIVCKNYEKNFKCNLIKYMQSECSTYLFALLNADTKRSIGSKSMKTIRTIL
jgi:hypothetical protein